MLELFWLSCFTDLNMPIWDKSIFVGGWGYPLVQHLQIFVPVDAEPALLPSHLSPTRAEMQSSAGMHSSTQASESCPEPIKSDSWFCWKLEITFKWLMRLSEVTDEHERTLQASEIFQTQLEFSSRWVWKGGSWKLWIWTSAVFLIHGGSRNGTLADTNSQLYILFLYERIAMGL